MVRLPLWQTPLKSACKQRPSLRFPNKPRRTTMPPLPSPCYKTPLLLSKLHPRSPREAFSLKRSQPSPSSQITLLRLPTRHRRQKSSLRLTLVSNVILSCHRLTLPRLRANPHQSSLSYLCQAAPSSLTGLCALPLTSWKLNLEPSGRNRLECSRPLFRIEI